MKNRRFRTLCTAITLAVLAAVALSACGEDVPDNFADLSPAQQAVVLPDRPTADKRRDEARKALQILELSGIKAGDIVVDLMGGGGYYSELFQHLTGDSGQVYLHNNSLFLRFSTEEMEQRLGNNRLSNVTRLDSEFADLQLPQRVDLIFLGLSFHDLYVKRDDPVITADPQAVFDQMKRALPAGGKVLVIDHVAAADSGITSAQVLHRIDPQFVRDEFQRQGFELVSELDILRKEGDRYDLSIWEDETRRNTDRMVMLFRWPGLPD